jgi:hypothetical protein
MVDRQNKKNRKKIYCCIFEQKMYQNPSLLQHSAISYCCTTNATTMRKINVGDQKIKRPVRTGISGSMLSLASYIAQHLATVGGRNAGKERKYIHCMVMTEYTTVHYRQWLDLLVKWQ